MRLVEPFHVTQNIHWWWFQPSGIQATMNTYTVYTLVMVCRSLRKSELYWTCAPQVILYANNPSIDQITVKTPNTKSRLYWCLNRVYRLEIQSVMLGWYIFSPLLWTSAPLTFSQIHPPPLLPFPEWIITGECLYTVCNRKGGGDRVMWRASTWVIVCVFDQIPNLQNCFITANKKARRGGGLRQIKTCREVPLLVNFQEKLTFRVWCLYRYLVHNLDPRRCIAEFFTSWDETDYSVALSPSFYTYTDVDFSPVVYKQPWMSILICSGLPVPQEIRAILKPNS